MTNEEMDVIQDDTEIQVPLTWKNPGKESGLFGKPSLLIRALGH